VEITATDAVAREYYINLSHDGVESTLVKHAV